MHIIPGDLPAATCALPDVAPHEIPVGAEEEETVRFDGTRPIIMDEPQNMESALARSAFATLHPIFG